jgi:hypothetical protein
LVKRFILFCPFSPNTSVAGSVDRDIGNKEIVEK